MNVSDFASATQVLLAEEPEAVALARGFAEECGTRIDLAAFNTLVDEELHRGATARDRMRVMSWLLQFGEIDLLLRHLHAAVSPEQLLQRYANGGWFGFAADGMLVEMPLDWRRIDYETGALIQVQGHDPFSGTYAEVVADSGEEGIITSLWSQARDALHARRTAILAEIDTLPAPSWATSPEGCHRAQTVRDTFAGSGVPSPEDWRRLARWLEGVGDMNLARGIADAVAARNLLQLHLMRLSDLTHR